jgi:AcrR family transcriptional regulator
MSSSTETKAVGRRAASQASSGLKGTRGAETRERIREAANELFLKDGFRDTTVDAIVAASGVSKGTFYLYFRRKEDLLLEYGARRLRRVREMLPDLIGEISLRDAIEAILNAAVREKKWDREITRLAILEMSVGAKDLPMQSYEVVLPLVEVGQARGQVRTDVPAAAVAKFIVRSILGALLDWAQSGEEEDRESALDNALQLVVAAFEPQSGD